MSAKYSSSLALRGLVIRSTFLVTHVVSSQFPKRHLACSHHTFWHYARQVVPWIDVCIPHLPDLAIAHEAGTRVHRLLHEGGGVGQVGVEDVRAGFCDFFEALQT